MRSQILSTRYEHDSLGRRVKRILAKDTAEPAAFAESLDYDSWGNLWHRTDFACKTTTFGYDASCP